MRIFLGFALLGVLAGCGPGKFVRKSLQSSASQLQHHTGFVLYDPAEKKTLVSINPDKYFTPASNTKIFTLYAGLKFLGDSIPGLHYVKRKDSLIFWGTGDPSFLYKDVFDNKRTYAFLKTAPENLFFSNNNFFEQPYGPGWSWDDYQNYYQVERSALPVYGNLIAISKESGIQPRYFRSLSQFDTTKTRALSRAQFTNDVFINGNKIPDKSVGVVPFITSAQLTARLLSDTLNRKVSIVSTAIPPKANVLFSIPADSLYRVMMQASDNFIAEQILLMCSQKISDSLKSNIAIEKTVRDFLTDLPDDQVWVDGSGLSRYNQFTPRSIVRLWEKIYEMIPPVRLFPILTANGKSGTLRTMITGKQPFIFGKTGSLANNYCLSGYIVTKKNHVLIFSSMNANFVSATKRIRDNLENILIYIYDHY